jgi:O-antigen/teichoic acid export membrane protein
VSLLAAASAAVNVGLNFCLVPSLGVEGAAWATLLSYVVWNVLNVHYSRRFYGLRFELGRVTHACLIGSLLAGATLALPAHLGPWVLWPVKTGLALSYPPLLVATGFLRPDELDALRRAVQGVRRRGFRGVLVALTQP